MKSITKNFNLFKKNQKIQETLYKQNIQNMKIKHIKKQNTLNFNLISS